MNLSMEPAQWAEVLAQNAVASMQERLQRQQASVKTEQSALTALKTALSDFQTLLKGFGGSSSGSGLVKNSATANLEGFVRLSASASASKGLYEIEVKGTAASKQIAFSSMTNEGVAAASGMMTIEMGDKTLEIDMDSVSTMAELRDAINKHEDNPGVTASLMKINGETKMMMGSEKTGEASDFTISGSADFLQADQIETIAEARDAVIRIGSMEVTSSTNTFKDLIPGVEINVIQKTDPARPLIISVENDQAGTKEQMQKFVEGYNALRTQLDELTKSGGEKEGRGAMAGDSAVYNLEQQLNEMLRQDFNGKTLSDFGISADRKGKLELDSETFNERVRDNPAALDGLFSGNDGLVKKMDKTLDSFLNSTTGSIKARQSSLDRKNEQITAKTEQIQLRYDASYARYLKEFTRTQAAMTQMENTMAQFF